jgi:hypothetical protein
MTSKTNDMPIDMVFTYVDGEDPAHKEKRLRFASYCHSGEINFDREPGKSIDMLYNNVKEITYSVRSVLKYLPWIRTIYIVTDSQIPPVDQHLIDSVKVRIVDHSEIIPEEYLPTFNSAVIESCLHRIPGLSEIFLYNNDDYFHFSPVAKEMLYKIDRTGTDSLILYAYCAVMRHLRHLVSELLPKDWLIVNSHSIAISNSFSLLINSCRDLNWHDIIVPSHSTFIIRKRTAFRLENELDDAIHACRQHRFRTPRRLSYSTLLYTMEKKWHIRDMILKPSAGTDANLQRTFSFRRYRNSPETSELWQKVVESNVPFACLNNIKSFDYESFTATMRKKGLGEPVALSTMSGFCRSVDA